MNGHPLRSLQRMLDVFGIDAFLVTHMPHVRLLSGFSGSHALLLVKRRSAWFVSDGRYGEQAGNEVRDCTIRIARDGVLIEELSACGAMRNVARAGFDEQRLHVASLRTFRRAFRGIRFTGLSNVVEPLGAVKSPEAIRSIAKAVAVTDAVFTELLPFIKPGVRERDLAAEISYRQRLAGADGDAFEPIVLSGSRSSLVHGRPSARKIRPGDLVLLDFGCKWKGYCSDMTRTVAVGRISPRFRRLYNIVREAQCEALRSVLPGASINAADAMARGRIAKEGCGDYFTHGLGHGIGLEVHEPPFLSWRSRSVFEPGNVVTVEPGIYVPRRGGIRIEDIVVVEPHGTRILTRSTKDLLIL